MPKLRVNFADATDFEALPAGTYPVVVEETEIREGAAGDYVHWTFTVEAGEHASRRVWLNTSTAAPGMIRDTLRALGEDIPNDVTDFDFDPDDYLGKRASAVVTQRTYDDRLVNDVKRLLPAGGAGGANGKASAKAGAGIR